MSIQYNQQKILNIFIPWRRINNKNNLKSSHKKDLFDTNKDLFDTNHENFTSLLFKIINKFFP